MIKSMTGYGRARQELHKRDITVEVRSVNNRYLDCTVKMPRMYAFAEDAVKKHVQQAVSRGKVDVFITVDATAADADKVAVDEETVRLRSHVAQLRTMLESDEPMGRKMDFLIQEVNRESNTIGSKCNDVAIANVVVGLKAEVEKMREQVQNVE